MARYLRLADRLLPARVVGLYVVGSIALGAYREARSDVDLVVVLDRRLARHEVRRVRALQLASGARTSARALVRGRWEQPGTCNATFVVEDDLTLPVTRIRPTASHVGTQVRAGEGFDVNPVVWRTLADAGIAVRGPVPADLALDPEPAVLAAWNRRNLDTYWRTFAERLVAKGPSWANPHTAGWLTAWGVLGPPRLHHTILTGAVISKEAAGEWARTTYDERWHPVIDEALAWWRSEPSPDPDRYRDRARRWREIGGFGLEVVRAGTAAVGPSEGRPHRTGG